MNPGVTCVVCRGFRVFRERLGEGSFAKVKRCEEEDTGRMFAMKVCSGTWDVAIGRWNLLGLWPDDNGGSNTRGRWQRLINGGFPRCVFHLRLDNDPTPGLSEASAAEAARVSACGWGRGHEGAHQPWQGLHWAELDFRLVRFHDENGRLSSHFDGGGELLN